MRYYVLLLMPLEAGTQRHRQTDRQTNTHTFRTNTISIYQSTADLDAVTGHDLRTNETVKYLLYL